MLSNKVNLQQDERRWLLQQLHGQFVCDQTQDQSSGEGSESRMVTPGQHGVQAQTYCEKELGVRVIKGDRGGERERGKEKEKEIGGNRKTLILLDKIHKCIFYFPSTHRSLTTMALNIPHLLGSSPLHGGRWTWCTLSPLCRTPKLKPVI